jgi:hypothetical protein
MVSRCLLLIIAIFTLSTALFSQPDSSLSRKQAIIIGKTNGQIKFDGAPDEDAWDAITPMKMIMYSPNFGKDPTEKTDIRITYDNSSLYIGARIFYHDPGMKMTASFKRDYMGMGGDWFGIILDTYNDKENGVGFFTSPDAIRWDASIQRDGVIKPPDQMPINLSWNTFWDVLTKQDSTGWSVEFRIPLSSLRFQEINGEVRMGLIIQRWIPAKNETDLFPAIPPNWGETSAIKPSQAQEIVFRGIKPDRPLYIAPYLLAGYGRYFDLNESETDYYRTNDLVTEPGVDVKFGLAGNLVADLTINTDFAQIEADDQQINLTRFLLYFPEKRTFFLERAGVFDFNIGGTNNLFYSRRIGLSDDGDPIRIYGGARLTGRLKKWDIGFMDMQTAPLWKKYSSGNKELILPSENFGVMRLRRQVINDNSYVGAMMTSRLGNSGSFNIAYGLDGIFRVFGNDYLDLKWSQTFEDSTTNSSFKDPSRIMINWERRSEKGLGYNLGYSLSGIHFNPGIGFEMVNDYTSFRGTIRYGWLPGEKSKLYRHSPEERLNLMRYIVDGKLMTFSSFTSWSFQTKNRWQGELMFVYSIENLRDSLELIENEVYIPPADYNYLTFRANFSTPGSKPFFVMLRTETGQYYDGTRLSAVVEPTWNISRHFELGGTYNFDYLNFSRRDLILANHIVGIKALYMFSTKLSVNLFLQYNSAVHGIITNLRLRFNPKEGHDLYLVFNEGRNTNLTSEMPKLPVYSSRAFMVKYTYTFNL